MHTATGDPLADLATREDMETFGQRVERVFIEESARTRRQNRVQFENLRDDLRAVGERLASIRTMIDQTIRPILGNHERRITVLEAGRGPEPVRRRR